MSKFAFINRLGVNFPCLVEDVDGDLAYEHTLIPFIGFNDSDFRETNGIVHLNCHCEPVVTDGNNLVFKKTSYAESDEDKVILLYSFPIMDGGEFGAFPGMIQPEVAFRFRSGNPDSGYFFEMIFILKRDTPYEILYHSEVADRVTAFDFHWNSKFESIETRPRKLM